MRPYQPTKNKMKYQAYKILDKVAEDLSRRNLKRAKSGLDSLAEYFDTIFPCGFTSPVIQEEYEEYLGLRNLYGKLAKEI